MIFSCRYFKEAEKKAKEDNGYFTAEMVIGYLMSNHPIAFLLDVIGIPIVAAILLIWFHK